MKKFSDSNGGELVDRIGIGRWTFQTLRSPSGASCQLQMKTQQFTSSVTLNNEQVVALSKLLNHYINKNEIALDGR